MALLSTERLRPNGLRTSSSRRLRCRIDSISHEAGEQVAIVSDLYDWTYLLAAHRAPLMFFLPSADIFTRVQLEELLRRINKANYLFVPKGSNGQPNISLADFDKPLALCLARGFKKMVKANAWWLGNA